MCCHDNNQTVLTDMEHDVNLTGTLSRTLPGHGVYSISTCSTATYLNRERLLLFPRMQCIFSSPYLSPIVKLANLRISLLLLILLFVFIISSSSVHLIQVTHTRVVLPRMMCRFSNTDSEVTFSVQDWISRNPEKMSNLLSEKLAEAKDGHLDLSSTCDFFDCPEVLQLLWVYWWDFVIGIPAAAKEKKSDM